MEDEYKSKKLSKSVDNPKAIIKNYGTMARIVKKQLEELHAAQSLEYFRYMPHANCQELMRLCFKFGFTKLIKYYWICYFITLDSETSSE